MCFILFGLILQDVVETHPGLTFLKDAPEFHSRYITTVGWLVSSPATMLYKSSFCYLSVFPDHSFISKIHVFYIASKKLHSEFLQNKEITSLCIRGLSQG